ncbi:hypothetical protein LTR37_003694 [Vermiconidia calcicola]|uniref:Uncharacterized protein n=1 Tax=Vermiconidia calcicola TaxID=1690605 RepID=A0ACC3NQB2_9PEZI|nr:hypothetical protein LTR37_003694 [Vermiconidia calcicola]
MSPKYLYKILDQQPPDPLPETLPATALDTQDGFIHLSTAEQTPVTARLFFSDFKKLWILKLESNALDGRLEFTTDPKAGVENGCAHVHGSMKGLGKLNVVAVIEVDRKDGQDWSELERMRAPEQEA